MQTICEHPWSVPAEQVAQTLHTNADNGLSDAEAQQRLQQYGPNQLQRGRRAGPLMMFLRQFADLMIALLMVAAIISVLIDEWPDAILIGVIVLANAIIGFVQEWRAEKAIEALQALSQPTVNVRRDGRLSEIPAAKLVPGDIVELSGGDFVPADIRLLETSQLEVDEAALTGESLPVEKTPQPVSPETVLPDRTSMAFSGTAVMKGNGSGVVTGTGMSSELGRIATMLSEAEQLQTPLQRRLAGLSRRLAIIVVAVAIAIFAIGVLRESRSDWNAELFERMLLVAVSLAVAAIPEGLPAVVTVTLALGSQRMASRNAIIRQLPAVETLGSVNVICTDKTGTLTQNRMRVADVVAWDDSEDAVTRLLTAAVLCNDAELDAEGHPFGSATEAALLLAAEERSLSAESLRNEFPRVDEIAFSSARKRMTTLHRTPQGERWLIVKGAVEQILDLCDAQGDVEHRTEFQHGQAEEWSRRAQELARRGRRMLAVAVRRADDDTLPDEDDWTESSLSLLGIVGIVDPVRKEVKGSIQECRDAGIRPVMITGDHAGTAEAIADEIALRSPDDLTITGTELERHSDSELTEKIERTAIFARVAPEHKLRIVRAYQSREQVVAMTGDGVNDAPALKQADIGVAMGIAGTDVAKASAEMILADDNFATIVAAVEEGRVVYDNIRKFVRYLLTANTGEILLIAFAILLGYPIPLLPVHILWINLVTDGLPALALGFEPAEQDVMQRPPRDKDESLFDWNMISGIVSMGLWMGAASLLLFAGYLTPELAALPESIDRQQYARSLTFLTLSVFQLFYVLGIRSKSQLFFEQGALSNWRLMVSVLIGTALQFAVIYVPVIQPFFHTVALSWTDLGIGLTVASSAFFGVEGWKLLKRSRASSHGSSQSPRGQAAG